MDTALLAPAIDPGATVAALVTENLNRSRVFERYGIDYCCGGKISLSDACHKGQVSLPNLCMALLEVDTAFGKPDEDLNHMPLRALADYIVREYHVPLRNELESLDALFAHVVDHHGAASPELGHAQAVFLELRPELEEHLDLEERWLFPLCRSLEGRPSPPVSAEALHEVTQDHEEVGRKLNLIRRLLNDYAQIDGACRKRQVLYHRLQALERELHEHIHVENNILVPRLVGQCYVYHET